MPRGAAVTENDPAIPLWPGRLDWAWRRAGFSQETLARRVSSRLRARHRRHPGQHFPRSVTAAAISYWRTGKRKTCQRSVLTALAEELSIPTDFLRADVDAPYLPVDVRLPGARPFRIQLNWSGWVGEVQPSGRVVGSWDQSDDAAGAIVERSQILAEKWSDLHWWRSVLLAGYDPEDAFFTDDEELNEDGAAVETGGNASLDFFYHMLAALKIALAPVAYDAELNEEAVGRFLSLFGKSLAQQRGEQTRTPSEQ